jgi:hypothetical protein
LRKYIIARGWVCVGYPIPCLGKSEAPFCLGGGLVLCVSVTPWFQLVPVVFAFCEITNL